MIPGNELVDEDGLAMALPFSKPLEFEEMQFVCDVYVMCREGESSEAANRSNI